jgi:hypothetical protein
MMAAVATAISNAPRGETAVLKSVFLADDTIAIDASPSSYADIKWL